MTKKLLKQVNVTDFTTSPTNPKVTQEALSSYIIANYLFENIDNRIKFFDDINRLFNINLRLMANSFYSTITTRLSLAQVTNLFDTNIKLVYKGGNMINYYLATYRRIFAQLNIQIDLDTLSDFDFNILINYDVILSSLGLPRSNDNLIKLSKLADLIAYNTINHFNNYMFCFKEQIIKKSIVSFSNRYPNTCYYQLGESNLAHIQGLFTYAKNYFDQLIQATPNPNIISFINANLTNLGLEEYQHNLAVLFDIIKQCAKTEIEFVGFALPTTFNKHKKIFTELALITENNSMKLNSFVKKLLNITTQRAPDVLSTSDARVGKIRVGTKLVNLDKRYDRIKTKFTETFPSDDSGAYCQFLPLNVEQMYTNQTNSTNGLISRYQDSANADIGFSNFYSIRADQLILTEEIEYNKFITPNTLTQQNYTQVYSDTFHESYEDMISISANYSHLFGTKDSNNIWIKMTNFNLIRGKIPIRYYLKLSNPYNIDGNLIEYLFVDYLGELIDMSIPTYGDSNLRSHLGADFSNMFKIVNIQGTNPISNINVNTYTELYFISDLNLVLFETDTGKPWQVAKYEKRISRLVKLFMVYLRYNFNIVQSVKMYNYFICILTKVQEQFETTSTIDVSSLLDPLEPIDDILLNFLYRLENLANGLSSSNPTEMAEMNTFLEFVLCNFNYTPQCAQKFPNVQNLKQIEFLKIKKI